MACMASQVLMQLVAIVHDEVSDETLHCRLLGHPAARPIAIYIIGSQPMIRKFCLAFRIRADVTVRDSRPHGCGYEDVNCDV